jgi:predicted outer membrane repeat protein
MAGMLTCSLPFVLGLLAATPAFAATLDVDVAGTTTYLTIQSAIDAATSGDNIRVLSGTYNESLNYGGKKLYIYSKFGSKKTTLDAGGAATWAVTVSSGEASGTTLDGFTLKNSGAGGIYVASSDLALVDVQVEGLGSTGYYGSGLYASSATITTEDSSFSDITSYIGAVYAANSTLTFDTTSFADNYAYYGAAVYATNSDIKATTLSVTGNENLYGGTFYLYDRCTFDANGLTATGNTTNYGSGSVIMAAYTVDVTLTDGTVSDNYATYASSGYYGAIYVDQASALTATDITFANNEGYGGGGATVANYSSATFESCTFDDHTTGYYGPLFVVTGSDVTVNNSSFSGNSAAYYGGAIYVSSTCTLAVDNSTFDANRASYYGGAIYTYYYVENAISDSTFTSNESTNGGAIYAQQLYSTMTVEGCEFSDNAATTGAGGAIYSYYYADMAVDDTTFTNNSAASTGGAISAYSIYGTTAVSNSAFTGNSATSAGGGAISAQSYTELEVTDTSFTENTAASGGAIYGYYLLGEMSFDGCTFTANESAGAGGAVYAYYYTETSISDCSFDQNVAYTDGGAILAYYEATPLKITNSTFSQNNAEHGSGGGVWAYYVVEAELSGNSFTDNFAYTSGGGFYGAYLVDLTSTGDTFTANEASKGYGGGIYQDGIYAGYGNAWLTGTTLTDNTASVSGGGAFLGNQDELALDGLAVNRNTVSRDFGGGLYLGGNGDYSVSHTQLCGNTADEGGGVYATNNTGAATWTNNIVQENEATYAAGVGFVNEPALSFTNNTLLGNDAAKDGGNLYLYVVGGTVVNNIVAWSVDGDGIVVDDTNSATDTTFTYNDFYGNLADDASGYLTAADLAGFAGNVFVDPDLYAYSSDGDCDNDVLLPNGTSPMIDAGDPAILDGDGSVSDIGAYGGPDNDIEDADGDGYASVIDCNDLDASIHPGATEVLEDGIDQDCDGSDLTAADIDRDGDGYQTTAAGGTDCDDTDASVHPGASEVWYDGTDQDCDGNDDDQDSDGWPVDGDCDDTDAAVSPAATEVAYNGVDDDCDERTSDSDVDGDGFDADVVGGEDCNDDDEEVNPDAAEIWYDGADQDCSGGSDHDQDGDGHDAAASGGDDCNDLDATKITAEDCGIGGDDTGPDDTGIDNGNPADTGKDDVSAGGDCGCASVPGLLALVALARRRRR